MPLGRTVHYEIIGRRGSSWTILAVINDRKTAVSKAEGLWSSRQYTGVKVAKESYDKISQEFSSVEIFSRGTNRKKSKYDQTGTISPCLTPDDLYSPDGRRSIWELLGNTLSDWMITPTELLHSLDHYYKLYNTGTKLQNAIQRTAVAFEDEQESIQERMRKIQKVIDQALDIMKSNKEKIPSLEMGRLRPIIEQLADKSNKRFLLVSSITDYLAPAVTVGDKLGRTIMLLAANRPTWVLEILDQLISELMQYSHIPHQLFGEPDDRGKLIKWLAYLQVGQLNMMGENEHSPVFSDDVLRLNGFLSQGQLPQVARVLFDRTKLEIEAAKPLSSDGLVAQLQVLKELKDQFETLISDTGRLDALEDALAARSSRLLNSQAVGEMLYDIKSPIDQLNALLDLERFTIGHSNKRMVANFMLPVLTRPEYEATFVGLDSKQPLARMNDLTQLQKRIKDADLTEMHRRKISEKLDSFCRTIMDNTQILKKLHSLDISLQDKSKKILNMLAENFFTTGDCRDRAEHQVRIYMKQPHFTEGLINGMDRDAASEELKVFRGLLERAGISKAKDPAAEDAEAAEMAIQMAKEADDTVSD